MKIGYPCINRSINCTANKTFRLASYSDRRLFKTLQNNIMCLYKIFEYNVSHNMLFFRISSDLVPFASHPICTYPWQKTFNKEFHKIGILIKKYKMRISMHPDQFILINSPNIDIYNKSVRELIYHAEILDLMCLDNSAKIQIHVGGIYGNKEQASKRFVKRYKDLSKTIKKRLVIENDHKLYTASDCLNISGQTGIPVLFDVFHNSVHPSSFDFIYLLKKTAGTWKKNDGIPMIDYSSQQEGKTAGTHTESIDIKHFKNFLKQSKTFNFDIMLEIKDKEKSAAKAICAATRDKRFIKGALEK